MRQMMLNLNVYPLLKKKGKTSYIVFILKIKVKVENISFFRKKVNHLKNHKDCWFFQKCISFFLKFLLFTYETGLIILNYHALPLLILFYEGFYFSKESKMFEVSVKILLTFFSFVCVVAGKEMERSLKHQNQLMMNYPRSIVVTQKPVLCRHQHLKGKLVL